MNIDIFPLSEGIFTIGHDKVFHPFDIHQDVLHHRPKGSLLVEIQPFLLKMGHEYILLDTGLGFKLPNGKLQIYENLEKIGIDYRQITKVILSHLHKDHAGGISNEDSLGIRSLSFPNARYYVCRKEFDFALQKQGSSYIVDDFELLKNSPQTEWLTDKGFIDEYIEYEIIGGHCPYHISLLVRGEYQTIFFGADVAPQLKQLKTKYVAKYDFDGQRSMELRQEYARIGREQDWLFLFYHDVQHAVSRL